MVTLLLLPSWTVFTNDLGVIKQQTIVDSAGNARDLTGLSATLKVYKPGFNDASYQYLSVGISVNNPPSTGVVQWTVASADMAKLPVGDYMAQVVLTSAGYEEHSKSFMFYVRAGSA